MIVLATVAVRFLLVSLFFPFSALDKLLNFNGAVGQAQELVHARAPAIGLITVGLLVEILMPICVLTGFADRLAAFVLAGYCGTTAILWKRFWIPGDFWARGDSRARNLFWDFLKNFALAGGFLLLTIGPDGRGLPVLLHDPLASTHPYRHAAPVAGDDRPAP